MTDPVRTGLDTDLAGIARDLQRSTVQVFARGGNGSGLIASSDGIIITNAHVVRGKRVDVVFSDGRSAAASVVARATDRDLAQLSVDEGGLASVRFGDSRALRPGDVVMAVGNPLGLVGAFNAGIVHAADPSGKRVIADLLLLPGNSGGPLSNAHGEVVGVNAMVIDGLAVAIASDVVRRFLSAPDAKAYVGVVTQPLRIEVMGESRVGLIVLELEENAPASRSGVLLGDVLLGADGRLWRHPADLADAIERAGPGGALRLDVFRGGAVIGVDVIVGDSSKSRPRAA